MMAELRLLIWNQVLSYATALQSYPVKETLQRVVSQFIIKH